MKFSRKRRQFFLFSIDILILILNVFLALVIRNQQVPSLQYLKLHYAYFWLPISVSVMCFYTTNMYSLERYFWFQRMVLKVVIGCSVALLIGFASFYLFPSEYIRPQTVLVIYSLLSMIGIVIWRTVFDRLFQVVNHKNKWIALGWNETIQELVSGERVNDYMHFEPVAVFSPEMSVDTPRGGGIDYISDVAELEKLVNEYGVNTFVMALGQNLPPEVTQLLFSRIKNHAQFYSVPEFYEILNRKIPVGSINEQWVLQNLSIDGRLLYRIFKRLFDIVCSLILLVLTVWFWPVVALIIKCESKGPVFFKQVREGKDGKNFNLLKFRTMKTEQNTFAPTAKNDSRVTKFGNFMRKSRIDELPQLLNVLKGDMSLIGPRPERPELAADLEKYVPYYRQRLLVTPGITGWDQVSGEYHSPSAEDTYKKVQYDLYYIKNQSVFLDVSIFFKTIVTVFKKLGR